MGQLDSYLVTLGVKGQNLVLSTMDKIRKSGKEISKSKTVVDLVAKAGKGATGRGSPERIVEQERAENDKVKKTHRQEADEEKKSQSKLRDTVGRFGQGVQNFAAAASTVDPTATISSITSAIGTSLSGVSVLGVSLGRLPEGIASIANSTMMMAKNSVDMAESATMTYSALSARNTAAEHYGGAVQGGGMSRNERAMFIDAVSGSMGRIQQPLADELNKLVGTKDARALARVGAGDWESTGTDKGWMLGQVANSFQGLPPSIKQRLNASLLRGNAGEIQDMSEDQAGARRNAAWFADTKEKQAETLYRRSTDNGETSDAVKGMVEKLNYMQEKLYGVGLTFAYAIDETSKAIADLPNKIRKLEKVLESVVNNPFVRKATSAVGTDNVRVRPYKSQ